MTDEDNYHGFMKPLLDRAKKVLFPDDIETSFHGGGAGFGHLTSTDNVGTTASSSSRLNPGKGKKSKSSSRARRARLLAASKNSSSLATISSRSVAIVAGSRSAVRSDDNSLKLLKVRDVTGRSTDKENKVPKKNSFPLANKRGNFQKMDSLGAILANESKARLESINVSATARRSKSLSVGIGVVNVHRRKSKSSFQCSLSACSGNQQVNDEKKVKRYQKSTKVKFESRHRHEKGMGDSKQHASNRQDASDEPHRSCARSLTNGKKYSKEKSTDENEVNHRKGRRRSRCNHPVSSLVQNQVTDVNIKGNSGLSSLMALPASTQTNSSFNQKKATRKKRVAKKVVKDELQIQFSKGASNNTAETDIQSTDPAVTSLTNHVESLNIGNDQTNCSTPLTIRHRASPGGLTSPPGFLNRVSTISSSDIFSVYSPLADSNPKKRFDSKKTPDSMSAAAAARPKLLASPLATNMSISPNPYGCQPNGLSQNTDENERDACTEDSGIQSATSHDCLSPRICFESKNTPDNMVSAAQAMPSETETPALATNMSMSPNPSGYGPDMSNQDGGEYEREAFIQDNKPSDDTSHDCLSPRICFESKKTDNIVSAAPAMPSETETSALATNMSMSPNPSGYGPGVSNQDGGEYEREAFIQDNNPSDDTSHDCLSPRICFESKKTDNIVSAALAMPSEMEISALATNMSMSPNPYRHRPGHSEQNGGENDRETSYDCLSPRILITASTFISSPNIGGEALSVSRSNLFPSHIDEQEANTQSKSKTEKDRPGSDVLGVAAESAEMEVEIKIASPITWKNDKLSNSLSLHAEENKAKLAMEEHALAKEVVVDVKGDAEATQPRRSSRQSQQTDRFTVARWKKKKKNKGNKNGRQVRFNNVDNLARSAADLVQEKAGPSPVSEEAIAQNDVLNVSQGNTDTFSNNKGDSKNATTAENVEDSQGSNDEPKTLRRVHQETNPTSVQDADTTEPRRSSRQSKPIDRLTVARWRKKKKDREVQFDNSANLNKSADGAVEEKANPAPPLEEASAEKDLPDVSKENSESSVPDKTKAPENAFVAQNAEDSQWSNIELKTLRNAQKEINPTSALYWQEVAMRVGTRSSSECQNKWQSMVSTPKLRRRTKQATNIHHHLSMLDASMSTIDEEDDLFDSSPYREAGLEDNNDICATKFSNFGNSSGLSPCVNHNTSSNSQREEASALKFRRKGYNSYIENLRKDINRIEKKRNHQKTSHLSSTCTQIYAESWNGESQLTGKLLPDGTVKINEPRESFEVEEDDIWGDDEEEDEEE